MVRYEDMLKETKNRIWIGGNVCKCVERGEVLDKGVR